MYTSVLPYYTHPGYTRTYHPGYVHGPAGRTRMTWSTLSTFRQKALLVVTDLPLVEYWLTLLVADRRVRAATACGAGPQRQGLINRQASLLVSGVASLLVSGVASLLDSFLRSCTPRARMQLLTTFRICN